MSRDRHELELAGCTPIPLAHYLKALGVLRLVSEQVDSGAQGWWKNDRFWLQSTLDREGLIDFFLERYKPTPIVGPWGARSGFFPGSSESSAREALRRIDESESERFVTFRESITVVRTMLQDLGLQTKADADKEKLRLMTACRAVLSDDLLPWLDATYVLLNDGRVFPPLLGTGGNEGSGSYMSGFAQQVVEVLMERKWDHALAHALFDEPRKQVTSDHTPGHFFPGATGGANAGTGFEGSTGLNPWDFLFLLEGAICFAGACVKRLESHEDGVLAFPFCVEATGAGYGSASREDESNRRPEMWLPVWQKPTTLLELKNLFSEGRAITGARRARTAVDFARAIATLGVDRGIAEFERYGFQLRNGDRSNFSVALGRFHVKPRLRVNLIVDLEKGNWLERFRRVATSLNAPARAGRALRRLETAILELCQQGECRHVQNVLIALGEAEAAVAISPKLRDPKSGVAPVPLLSPQWLSSANNGAREYRLAAALASIGYGDDDQVGPLRRHLEPIDPKTWNSPWPKWNPAVDDPNIVFGGGLVRNLIAVLNRRCIEAFRQGKQPGDEELLFSGAGRCSASLGDIAAFVDGDVDDERIEMLLRGLILVNWRYVGRDVLRQLAGDREPMPDAAYALLKLCHLPHEIDGKAIPLTPAITHRAAAGDATEATRLAAQRLRGSGFPPAVDLVHCRGERARRTAAALLFPTRHSETPDRTTDVRRLMGRVLPSGDLPEPDEDTQEAAGQQPAAV